MLPKYTFWFLLLRPSHFKKLWGLAKWEPENATFGHIKSYFDQSETTYSKQFFLKNIFFSVLGSIYSKNRCKLHCKSFINLHFMHKLYWMKTEWDQARFGSALKIQFNMKTAFFFNLVSNCNIFVERAKTVEIWILISKLLKHLNKVLDIHLL